MWGQWIFHSLFRVIRSYRIYREEGSEEETKEGGGGGGRMEGRKEGKGIELSKDEL